MQNETQNLNPEDISVTNANGQPTSGSPDTQGLDVNPGAGKDPVKKPFNSETETFANQSTVTGGDSDGTDGDGDGSDGDGSDGDGSDGSDGDGSDGTDGDGSDGADADGSDA